ncbi:MAG: hypothetical protein V9F01_13945 [Chitinophagaceae bacterium]
MASITPVSVVLNQLYNKQRSGKTCGLMNSSYFLLSQIVIVQQVIQLKLTRSGACSSSNNSIIKERTRMILLTVECLLDVEYRSICRYVNLPSC